MHNVPQISVKLTFAISASLLISACSGGSSDLEEKLQRAEQAAHRAELAQAKAETAAQKAVAFGSRSNAAVIQEPETARPGEREDAKSQPDTASSGLDPKPDNPNS